MTVVPPPGSAAGLVVAHQGGWDEILLVLAPIAVFGLLLWLAHRRADAGDAVDDDEGAPPA